MSLQAELVSLRVRFAPFCLERNHDRLAQCQSGVSFMLTLWAGHEGRLVQLLHFRLIPSLSRGGTANIGHMYIVDIVATTE